MSNKKVTDALNDAGFELVRQKKHRVYQNAEGKTVVTSSTPSDRNAVRAQLRDIRRALREPENKPIEPSMAALPRMEKKGAGAAQAANHFDFYKGLAPRSVPATPEQTIKTLRGYLESKNAYKFQSELVKAANRVMVQAQNASVEAITACLRDFDAISQKLNNAIETEGGIQRVFDEGSEQEKAMLLTFVNARNKAVDILQENQDKPDLEDIRKMQQSILEHFLTTGQKGNATIRSAITSLANRAAKRLLRGDSANDIRQFLKPHIKTIQDKFAIDLCFNLPDFIEQIAAVIVSENPRDLD
jgi:predicted RNA binding protein YcfA (HicA-like mRNA interferase family)